MAKGIDVIKYRGLKARRGDKVVLHLTNDKGKKLHVRFPWDLWTEMINDLKDPIKDWEERVIVKG